MLSSHGSGEEFRDVVSEMKNDQVLCCPGAQTLSYVWKHNPPLVKKNVLSYVGPSCSPFTPGGWDQEV